jgi:hypothetical protein
VAVAVDVVEAFDQAAGFLADAEHVGVHVLHDALVLEGGGKGGVY